VPLEYSVVTSRARVPSESTATALLPHRPHSMPQTCTPQHAAHTRSRADRSDPPRPHAQKRRWQQGGTHSCPRLMSAESQLGTLPVSVLLLRSLRTRSGLGRSGGTTPHPLQQCAPTVPAHCTHREGCALSTPQSHRVPRVPSESIPHQPCCHTAPRRCPRHASPDMPRARSRADRSDPTLLGRTRASAVGNKGVRTVVQDW
jgi:hypothetical protein